MVATGRIRLGEPYPIYDIPADRREAFLVDPDPLRYATRVRFDYPVLLGDSVVGSVGVRYNPTTPGVFYPDGWIHDTNWLSGYASRTSFRPGLSYPVGVVVFGWCGSDYRFACLDSAGTLAWVPVPINAHNVRSGDLVLVGTVKETRFRAVGVFNYADSTRSNPARTRYYDTAKLDVEAVLKWKWDAPPSLFSHIFYQSRFHDERGLPDLCKPVLTVGERLIFVLREPVAEFDYYAPLISTIPLDFLEEAIRFLPDCTKDAATIRRDLQVRDRARADR